MSFIHVHHSGRFDRTAESLVSSFYKHVDVHGADVISFTEVASEHRGNALAAAVKAFGGWEFIRPDGAGQALDECALAYDSTLYRPVESYAKVVSEIITTTTNGKPRPPFSALFVVLEEIATKRRTVFVVAHTPSHVENGGKWYENRRAAAHRDGLKNIATEVYRLGKKWKVNGRKVIAMDLNLDVAKAWVQAYLALVFRGPRLFTDSTFNDTLGKRTVDVVIVGRYWKSYGKIVVERVPDSDHKSIIVRITHE